MLNLRPLDPYESLIYHSRCGKCKATANYTGFRTFLCPKCHQKFYVTFEHLAATLAMWEEYSPGESDLA